MSGISTDVLALACVLGSAGTAGAVTLALATDDPARAADACVVHVADASPTVVLSLGRDGEGAESRIVVAPRVRAHAGPVCVEPSEAVEIRMDEVRVRMERARERMERARERAERARERLKRAQQRELEAEMRRVEERLEKVRAEIIGA